MQYQNILLQQSDRVAVLTINRPEKRNALNQATRDEILHALDNLQQSDSRVLVVTGAGGKAFIAGADIGEFEGRTALTQREVMKQRRVFDAVEEFPKPVIAMINGFCLGGGMEFALACDIRIAADSAKLGQPEINLGIIPGGGGTQRLTRLVGEGKAMELILTGDLIDGNEAKAIGLVNDAVPIDQLQTRVMALAVKLAEKSPIALRMAKEAVKTASRANLREGLDRETDLFCLAFSSEDKVEGVRAFFEKRKPDYKGR
ncbi:MAG: enoyl-CoA hydratase/isomerase family protein [Acidobacteria bacterium]|nr:enoyl-CoA hydratase/isomerase family protein [Acidobacteriota bacterium]